MRLWNYVSTFSNLSGERLHQIYSKLKQERDEEAGPSHANGSASGLFGRDGDPNHFTPFSRNIERQRGYRSMTTYQSSEPFQKGHDTAKFEAWKRRRRTEGDNHFPIQAPPQRPMSNAIRLSDPNSLGILGAAPFDGRQFGNERPFKMRQTGLPPRQGFSSSVK